MRPAAADPGGPSAGQESDTSSEQALLWRAFSAYNAQDADGLLALVSDDMSRSGSSGSSSPLDGSVISTGTFQYVFRIKGPRIVGLDIENA